MSAPPSGSTGPSQALQRGIVKQVISGDTVVVRGPPRGGPPPERTVGLSNITAPRLARRPNVANETQDSRDEPFAWEARESLRKKLVGREICFTVEYKAPGTSKEYGCIYVGKDTSAENVTESLVAEGLVEVRRGGIKPNDENQQKLIQLEDSAKAAGKGKWGSAEELAAHVRDIKWTIDNPRQFVDANKSKEIEAVIEHVRDGCTIRAFLLPSFQYVTLMLSGLKSPMFKIDDDNKTVPEPFAEEAKYFTEVRLLQRDVKILLEGTSNQNLLGSIIHPNGNISELLLQEGFARCADWSMKNVTIGPEKLRAAEKIAKDKKVRLWKDFQSSPQLLDVKEKNFQAKVVEIVNGDGLVVKMPDGSTSKLFLASIRSPRMIEAQADPDGAKKKDLRSRPRPLYDIPYMFEAREFLRKKLIGKKVGVQVDYIQPKSPEFPEKTCCTISFNSINVAEALVSKGLATVVRYRQGDDQRSSCYDDLLKAEDRAEKKGAGLHSKKDSPVMRVSDLSGDVQKSKQFLPFLTRAGKTEALVEFVASGSRMRIYIPKETCLVTVLLSGIECPRGSRPAPNNMSQMIPADPYGDEALVFTKEAVLQREVEVEVESMDKGGNFIGWVVVEGVNLSVALVEEGLAKVHFTAERTNHYKSLLQAEAKAKEKRLNIWSTYEEPKEEEVKETTILERKINYKTVVITEVTKELQFYAQNVETGPLLEKLMEQLRADFVHSPPLTGAYAPKKGDLCAAKFSDGEWYRGRVDKVTGTTVAVTYVDYGNKEVTEVTRLATLPAAYQSLPFQASEYALACIIPPKDEEDIQNAVDFLYNEVLNKQYLLNNEYKTSGLEYVTLVSSKDDTKEDIAKLLISNGLVQAEGRKEKYLSKIVTEYKKAEEKAKESRKNIWRYGDFTEDDVKEFGYQK